MTSKEKTIVAVLAVVIILALAGIGVLAAQLIGEKNETAITVVPTSGESAALPVTATPPPPPTMTAVPIMTPTQDSSHSSSGQLPVVARAQSAGPGLPAIITDHPLKAGHRYRLVIISADNRKIAIEGNWSQAATSASGKVAAPQIEFFKGATPYTIEVISPVPDPTIWGVSVSAMPQNPVGQSAILVILLYDVTGQP